jgi:biopolymer transport protein ExbB/TolQ
MMAKKQLKREVKRPDLFMHVLWRSYEFLKVHSKMCILGGVIFATLIAAFLLYLSYLEKKNDELQYKLSEGARLFRESLLKEDLAALLRCEEILRTVEKEKKAGISEIAKIYLAKIKEKRGDKKEAEKLIRNIRESSKNPVIREIAERTLKSIQ